MPVPKDEPNLNFLKLFQNTEIILKQLMSSGNNKPMFTSAQ